MQALKDKRKFGWGKPPKNRNCKKFGIQRGGPYGYRNALHILLQILSSFIFWII